MHSPCLVGRLSITGACVMWSPAAWSERSFQGASLLHVHRYATIPLRSRKVIKYIPGRNFRSNCRNYRRALLLFEMDVANPPSPVQIEAIGFSRSKAKNCFYLNEPLENMQKQRVFWVLLIKYDNFSGKLTRIVHFCAEMCKKTLRFQLVLNFWLNVWPQMSMIPL